jgi:hypothetical protein
MVGKQTNKELKVYGATIHGFTQACINLNIVAGSRASNLIKDINVNEWYPFKRLRDLEKTVLESYKNVAPIMERVGMEMMLTWYNLGPGKGIIKKGVDFLYFQSGSQGYHSVVQGPEEQVGNFDLVEIDEKNGKALIHSTDPFNKDLERGVIIGGMTAPGDLDYIDVNNNEDEHFFNVEFY